MDLDATRPHLHAARPFGPWAVLPALVALLTGCGPEQGHAPEAPEAGTLEQALSCVSVPATPAHPTAPQDLGSYPWGTPLVPPSARSAYAVLHPDHYDPNRFVAIGFDVDAGRTLFYVSGYRTRHLELFRSQYSQDIAAIQLASSPLPDFTEAMGGGITGGPVGPGPGMVDPLWRIAYQNRRSNAGQAFTCVTTPSMPAIPRTPQDLSTYAWGTPLVPSTSRSAYGIVYPHPTDSSRFMAIGFDVDDGRTLFYVTGDKKRYLQPFRDQFDSDVNAIEARTTVTPGFTSILGGHLLKPSSSLFTGIDSPSKAWRAAYQHRASHAELDPK